MAMATTQLAVDCSSLFVPLRANSSDKYLKRPIRNFISSKRPTAAQEKSRSASCRHDYLNLGSKFYGSRNLLTEPFASRRSVVSLRAGAARSEVSRGDESQVSTLPEALLFDCDGVLVDTERDGHRVSFNQAFQEKGLDVVWGVDLYGELLKIGGGKERMTHYFNKAGWPAGAPSEHSERAAFVAELHKRKTVLFMELVETGALPLRPGVARLVDEALDRGVQVAVCSTSNEKAVSAIVRVLLGARRAGVISIFAGDVVPRKKPDPAIYTLAARTLGVDPARCAVIEDSHIGLSAAKAAGMVCCITKSGYTADEDFSAADGIFDCIGDAPQEQFDIWALGRLLTTTLAA